METQDILRIWRGALTKVIRSDQPDLTSRQLGVMICVYSSDTPLTVRYLAQELGLAKPAVTRALDRLQYFDFIKRKEDDADKRSVLIQRTLKGSVYLHDFADAMRGCLQG